jgi:hypothetical protein
MAIRVPYRYRAVLFALIMSCCTAFIVSGVIIYLHSESLAIFLPAWAKGFVTAWPLVFISILTIAPLVNRFINTFFDEP